MQKPGKSPDEPRRIATLHALDILDTLPEDRFDRLTRIARTLFNVSIATVSLVDSDRQWFKSCAGMRLDESPRDVSFCGHAILGDDVFVISDALADERFSDNPLVVNEPRIRFYAGCPLRAPDQTKLGTLCIIDQAPRAFDQESIELLKDMAAVAEREIGTLQLATTDDLTGLFNRRGFLMLAEQILSVCAREKLPATLFYMDLDDLKPINDKFGHAEGDRVLKAFAGALESTLRNADLVARLGGDEFAALLINHPGAATESSLARLDAVLEETARLEQLAQPIAYSIGVVNHDFRQPVSIDELLKRGDALMYQNKRVGD